MVACAMVSLRVISVSSLLIPTIVLHKALSQQAVLTRDRWVPHISLVFREMWETTGLNRSPPRTKRDLRVARTGHLVSHTSRKTSEMWGTQLPLTIGILPSCPT